MVNDIITGGMTCFATNIVPSMMAYLGMCYPYINRVVVMKGKWGHGNQRLMCTPSHCWQVREDIVSRWTKLMHASGIMQMEINL